MKWGLILERDEAVRWLAKKKKKKKKKKNKKKKARAGSRQKQ